MSWERDTASERSSRYRLTIFGGGLLALVLIHHVYVYAPIQQRTSHLHAQIQSARLEARKQRQTAARIPELEQELALAKKELEERMGGIAEVRDGPVLLERVAEMSRAAGLRILHFRPAEERRRQGYAEQPLVLRLDGKFHDFMRLLLALEGSEQLNKLGNIVIAADDPHPHDAGLGISLEILTYSLPEQGTLRPPDDGIAAAAAVAVESPSWGRLRDPFRPWAPAVCGHPARGLRDHDLAELELVGIVWEAREPKALVMDAAHAGHIIIPGSLIGVRGGVVKAITPTRVIVHEHRADGATIARSMHVKFTETPSVRDKANHQELRPRRAAGRHIAPLLPGLCQGTASPYTQPGLPLPR